MVHRSARQRLGAAERAGRQGIGGSASAGLNGDGLAAVGALAEEPVERLTGGGQRTQPLAQATLVVPGRGGRRARKGAPPGGQGKVVMPDGRRVGRGGGGAGGGLAHGFWQPSHAISGTQPSSSYM